MQFAPECVPCLLNRVLFEVKLVSPDRAEQAMEESLHILSEAFPKGMNSARLATMVHARAYAIAGTDDPYADLKRRSDAAAETVFPLARKLVEGSEDRLEAAARAAIAGNVLDFGIDVGMEGPEELVGRFEALMGEGLAIDDLERARSTIGKGSRVVYLLDNCGESVLDRLLIAQLKGLGATVKAVVKGAPILTDVTMEDAVRARLDRCADELLSTGSFAVGIDVARIGPRLRRELEEADLIVSKGMANLESLSDEGFRPILYLLRAKCEPVARLIGSRRDQNVARLCE